MEAAMQKAKALLSSILVGCARCRERDGEGQLVYGVFKMQQGDRCCPNGVSKRKEVKDEVRFPPQVLGETR